MSKIKISSKALCLCIAFDYKLVKCTIVNKAFIKLLLNLLTGVVMISTY